MPPDLLRKLRSAGPSGAQKVMEEAMRGGNPPPGMDMAAMMRAMTGGAGGEGGMPGMPGMGGMGGMPDMSSLMNMMGGGGGGGGGGGMPGECWGSDLACGVFVADDGVFCRPIVDDEDVRRRWKVGLFDKARVDGDRT